MTCLRNQIKKEDMSTPNEIKEAREILYPSATMSEGQAKAALEFNVTIHTWIKWEKGTADPGRWHEPALKRMIARAERKRRNGNN